MQILPWIPSFQSAPESLQTRAESLCEIGGETEISSLEDKYFNCARSLTANVFDRKSEEVGRSIFQSLHQYSQNFGLLQRAGTQDEEIAGRRRSADLITDLSLDGLGIALIGVGAWRGGLPGIVAGAILAVAIVYYTHKPSKLETIPTFDYRRSSLENK